MFNNGGTGSGLPSGGSVGEGVVNTGPGTGSWQPIVLPGNTPLFKTASYQLATNDSYVGYDCTSGALVATLPAAPNVAQLYGVLKTDTSAHTLTVTPASGTINGAATFVIGTQWECVLVAFDGTNWEIMGSYLVGGGAGALHYADYSLSYSLANNSQVTPLSGWTKVSDTDTFGTALNSTGVLTIPAGLGGIYAVSLHLVIPGASATTTFICYITGVPGVTTANIGQRGATGGAAPGSTAEVVTNWVGYMAAGATVGTSLFQTTGGPQTVTADFSIALV